MSALTDVLRTLLELGYSVKFSVAELPDSDSAFCIRVCKEFHVTRSVPDRRGLIDKLSRPQWRHITPAKRAQAFALLRREHLDAFRGDPSAVLTRTIQDAWTRTKQAEQQQLEEQAECSATDASTEG